MLTSRRRFGRALLATAMVGAGTMLLPSSPTHAAFGSLTKMEIDGNPVVNTTGDWDSTAAAYPELRDKVTSVPTEACDGTTADGNTDVPEADRVPAGTKLDDVNINTGPTPQPGSIPKKTDLCGNLYRAWELVQTPTSNGGGRYDTLFYFGWTRPQVQGEVNVLIPLLGPDPSVQTDDLVISYDFNDNTGATVPEILRNNGTTWAPVAVAPGVIEAFTDNTTIGGTARTMGEFAINLTLAGLLPAEGPCTTFAAGYVMSRTGNSPEATLEDYVGMPPLTLTNCGSLMITKETNPAGVTSPLNFGYHVNELDNAVMQAPSTTTIDGTLTVPTSPSVTIANLNISPDYVVTETTIPANWTEQSLVCTAFDPITGQTVTRTLFGSAQPDAAFPIAPNMTASCVITNVGPPPTDLQLVKSAAPTVVLPDGDVTFTIDVTNLSTVTADTVSVSDTLPAELQLKSATSAELSCTTAGNTLTCTKATMAGGEKATITVVAGTTGLASGVTVTNVATVSTPTPESNLANNTDDAAVMVAVLPPTGSRPGITLALAAGLVLLGSGGVFLSRRRATAPPS